MIKNKFIQDILINNYNESYLNIYNNNLLIQYLDYKCNLNNKRKNLMNIYCIYSLLHFYIQNNYCNLLFNYT